MVERRVTDGKRIGQLLASELTGLEEGVLAAVEVVDADPEAAPSETGSEAYRVAHCGHVIASVWLYPDHIEVCLYDEREWPDDGSTGDDTPNRDAKTSETPTVESDDTLRVDSGAAVKRVVDVLRVVLADPDEQ